ncbi:MAG: radical SAM protein [Clostridia bacterium]|nr:radical SAM protein [Clostridia bacterium]
MSIATSLARAWLTRSFKPFTFTAEMDETLDFAELERFGLYVHIPFCRSICSFCPYCKELYSKEKCDGYIDALLEEIKMVGASLPEKKEVTSLYFGGGSPALALDRIGEILSRIGEYFTITDGVGIELHPSDVTEETLLCLKGAGITKISIGIQSFSDGYASLLGRKAPDAEAIRRALAAVPFETVSMDFIFALPSQTFEDLKEDVDKAFEVGANHIAIYPFIDFTFTSSKVKAMEKGEKRALLDQITGYLTEKGYQRESIWTFSKEKGANYSSMTRETFLGFGASATTLLKDSFKVNTFSVEAYRERIQSGKLPTSLTTRFTERKRMVYWLFWTAYSTKVDERDFERFFGVPLKKKYGFELWLAKKMGYVTEEDGVYRMTLKGAFFYHHFEGYYTLSYIDKMWGLMRKQAFPKQMQLK